MMSLAPRIEIPREVRNLARFGAGIGIEIGPKDLVIVAVRVRPGSVRLLDQLTISDFAARPAAEWGAEYAAFLKKNGLGHVSATALLPRRDVISRQVTLTGVGARDMEGAIGLQLDSLHPFGEDEAVWAWSALGPDAALVGIVKRSTVDRYAALFAEAGVAVRSFTFPAAALHAAIGLFGAPPAEGFLALEQTASGGIEAYGESAARPVFSAEFSTTPERAASLAAAELRLPEGAAPIRITDALPTPVALPADFDLSRSALAFATALAGACPRLAPAANVLPPDKRHYRSRTILAPTIALAAILLLIGGGAAFWSRFSERRYLARLNAEIARMQPLQQRGQTMDRDAARARARAQWLDGYRDHTRGDLEILRSLTNLVEPPAWIATLDVTRDSVRMQGEARQAASLWKSVDSAGLFKSSNLDSSQPLQQGGESFVIRGAREAGK
jgi:hypothetical protein